MANNAFFDVLVDQIISDVRKELVDLARPNTTKSPSNSQPSTSEDDLVSRLINFRARQLEKSVAPGRFPTRRREDSKSEQILRMEALLGIKSGTPRVAVSPGFENAEAEAAFQVIAKYGAVFHVGDFVGRKIHPEAFKRERRRLLLNLHPDRQPEHERKAAHTRFLEAADAFVTLADLATLVPEDLAA